MSYPDGAETMAGEEGLSLLDEALEIGNALLAPDVLFIAARGELALRSADGDRRDLQPRRLGHLLLVAHPCLAGARARRRMAELVWGMIALFRAGQDRCSEHGVDTARYVNALALARSSATPRHVCTDGCPQVTDAQIVLHYLVAEAIGAQARQSSLGGSSRTSDVAGFTRREGALRRFPTYILSDRIRDIRTLTEGSPDLLESANAAIDLAAPSMDEARFLLHLMTAPVGAVAGCCLSTDRAAWLARAARCSLRAPWRDIPAQARTIIDAARESATLGKGGDGDRADFEVADAQFLLLDPFGYLDALLQAVISGIDDRGVSAWHEAQVSREFRQAFRGVPGVTVAANVSWAVHLDPDDASQDHSGEIDTYVEARDFRIDVQAKAARTLNYQRRHRLATVAAKEQHTRFRSDLQGGVHLITRRNRPSGPRFRLWKKASADRTLIPITVSLEEAGAWPVGGGDPTMHGVVRTTVDHLRLVRSLVPTDLQPVYWVSRWLMEHQPIRFVNEVSYLDYWCRTLGRESGVKGLQTITGGGTVFALAQRELVEQWIVLRSMVWDTRATGRTWELEEAALRRQVFNLSAHPRTAQLLHLVRMSGSRDWMAILTVLCMQRFDVIEGAIDKARNLSFQAPWGQLRLICAGDSGHQIHPPPRAGDRIVTVALTGRTRLTISDTHAPGLDLLSLVQYVAPSVPATVPTIREAGSP